VSAIGEAKIRSYDGLLAPSVVLWRQWLELYEDKFDRFFYNVRVGAGTRIPFNATPETRRMWWADSALRIDAVGERTNQTWVIEISPRVTSRVTGNLQLYAHLIPLYQGQNAVKRDVIANRNAEDFLIDTEIREIIIPALICQSIGLDMRATVEKAGIVIFEFPFQQMPKLPTQFMPSTLAA